MSVSADIKGVIGVSSSKISSPDSEFTRVRTRRTTVRIAYQSSFLVRAVPSQAPGPNLFALYVIVQTLAPRAATVTQSSRRQDRQGVIQISGNHVLLCIWDLNYPSSEFKVSPFALSGSPEALVYRAPGIFALSRLDTQLSEASRRLI
jgi:hypothetical protein